MEKSEEPIQTSAAGATKVKRKKSKQTKFRKAPQAPKRFKSPFILFSIQKHPEIRARLAKEENSNVPNVAKLVSIEWKKLSDEDRAVWIKMAEDDKKRFEMERTMYTGPWKIPASKRAKKDPDAPKRPMSAFLAYSKTMRSTVKSENQELSNTDVSKLLAVRWKDAPADIKSRFIEHEAEERQIYKNVMAAWKAKNDKMLFDQRKEREDMATLAVENGLGAIPPEFRPKVDAKIVQPPIHSMVHPAGINAGANMSYHHGPMYPSSYYDSYNTYRNPELGHATSGNISSAPGPEIQTSSQRLMHAPTYNIGLSHHDQPHPMTHTEPPHPAYPYNYYEEGMGYGPPHERRQIDNGYAQGGAQAGSWANGNEWYPTNMSNYHTDYIGQEGAHPYRGGGHHTERTCDNQDGQLNNSNNRRGYYSGPGSNGHNPQPP